MKAIVSEAIEAGALGFSTSRTIAHRAIDGEPVPGTFAAEDELFGIGRRSASSAPACSSWPPWARRARTSVAPAKEVDWMRALWPRIGRPVTFALLQVDAARPLARVLDESLRATPRAPPTGRRWRAGHRPALGPDPVLPVRPSRRTPRSPRPLADEVGRWPAPRCACRSWRGQVADHRR